MPRTRNHEEDPLLPYNPPAPEISSHGSIPRSASNEIRYGTSPTYEPQLTANQYLNNVSPSYGTVEVPYNETITSARRQSRPTTPGHELKDNPLERTTSNDSTTSTFDQAKNALSTIFSLFTIVVFFAIITLWLNGNSETPKIPNLHPPPNHTNLSLSERVDSVLTSTPLIDGHNDLAILIRATYHNHLSNSDFRTRFEKGNMSHHVDIPRLRSGKVGGAFWSAFVVCPTNASYDFSDTNYATAVSHTLEQIDVLRRLQAQYPRDFTPATIDGISSGREHMLATWHATRSFFGPISIEGLHQVPPSAPMAALRNYYAMGVRMATLTWNCHNAFADAAIMTNDLSGAPEDNVIVPGIFRPAEGALTKRGQKVVREMNRLGMIVDISHTSEWTQRAVLNGSLHDEVSVVGSRAPVVFSHSSAYALCPHPRNVKDEVLELVKKTNSLVMINFSPAFVSCLPPRMGDPYAEFPTPFERNNTLHQVARHVVYVGEKIGWDHVGLGSDFDGMEGTPRGLDGVDKYPELVRELLVMGVKDGDARKVVGGNLLRVWREVDAIAEKMRREGVEAGEDEGEGY